MATEDIARFLSGTQQNWHYLTEESCFFAEIKGLKQIFCLKFIAASLASTQATVALFWEVRIKSTKSRVSLEKADRAVTRSASRWLDTLNPCQIIVPIKIWYYQKLINATALIPTTMGSLRYCQIDL